MTESKPSILQFESEHGKIVTLLKFGKIVIKTESSNAILGEFPITEWRSFPLEIPASGSVKYIIGRFPGGLHLEQRAKGISQVIYLPVYTGEDICDARLFENFPTEPERVKEVSKVPVVSIATKSCARMDGRFIQSLSVLPVWNDGLSIVLELDWSEGNPMEDCANPEWVIRASPKLPVKEGLQRLKKCVKVHPLAEKCSYYLYVNPSSLGTYILGEGQVGPSMIWSRVWKYDECEQMLNALDRLSVAIAELFG